MNTVYGTCVGADPNGTPNLGNGCYGNLISGGDSNVVKGSNSFAS
jgi:hypothetical protein